MLRKLLAIVLVLTLNTSNEWRANALSWNDISDAFEDAIDTGSGIIDDISSTLTDLANSVASAFTSLGSAITGVAASCATWLYSLSDESGYTLVCIYSISELATDVIDDLLDGFNSTTWDKISDGAKYVLYNLDELVDDANNYVATYLVEYVAVASNFLSDLADYDDYMPYPFDVLETDDIYTVADCIDDTVLEAAIEFAEYVATKLVDLGTDGDLDITPIFNSEDIKDELNATYRCLIQLGKDIQQREDDDSSDDDNIIADLISEALSYFEFDELVHGIEIGFTACTLVCGSASIGFAVATESGQFAPYYVVSSGVETSSVVGASIEGIWKFWPNWDAVTGTASVVSFDASISLPLIPISIGPTVALAINDSGSFGGFELRSDIVDISLGFNGAFGLGYRYTSTYWIKTLSDLGDAWNAFEDVGEIAANNVELAIEAYNILKETLGSGGFLSETQIGTYSSSDTSSSTSSSRLLLSSDSHVVLTCPSGEESSAGNGSAIELGWIEINEVIYGNMTGDNWCNSSTAYTAVYDECAFLANCSLDISTQDIADSTFGDPECDDGVSYGLTIVYSCPSKGSVYDIGCYSTNYGDILEEGWIQDYATDSAYSYFMDDNWETRENSIAKCSKIADDAGYNGFAIYNHGMCLVGSNLLDAGVYNEYNASDCPTDPQDGLGDPVNMNLYIFATDAVAFEDLGCFNLTTVEEYNQDMVSMEGQHVLLQDDYQDRKLAVSKCAQVADDNDYDGFALFDNGACYVSSQSIENFEGFTDTNGTYDCGSGKGNSDSYNVYLFPYVTLSTSTSESSNDELSTGAVIGIVISIIILIVAIVVGVIIFIRKKKQNTSNSQVAYVKSSMNDGTTKTPHQGDTGGTDYVQMES